MIGRLTTALALLVLALVVPASPATASCAYDVVGALEDEHDVAFVGVDQRRVKDGDRLIIRFRVEQVHRGEVQRTQDVVVPEGPDYTSVEGADWSTGDRVLLLGIAEADGVLVTNLCLVATEGSEEYEKALAKLGDGVDPAPGVDRIEPEGVSRRDLLWLRLVMGVVGLAGVALVVARWVRSRRTPWSP